MKKIIFFFFIFCFSLKVFSQYIVLEGKVPENWKTDISSTLSISNEHFKQGSQSVKWHWKSGGAITIANPEGMKQALLRKDGGLMLWIYNESPVNAPMVFEFSNNGDVQYGFNYQLNFKGWRACWISFDGDMNGNKASKDLNCMKIIAPKDVNGGTLFFDRMKFPESSIHRQRTPDAQLPYINPEVNENHWCALWHWHSDYKYTLEKKTLEKTSRDELKQIEQQLTKEVAGNSFSKVAMDQAKENFLALGIKRTGDRITGPAYVSDDEYQALNKDLKMSKAGTLMNKLAKGWYFYQDSECLQMFTDLVDHLIDQGWAIGSGMGTNHHYGYQFREFAPSFLLMKKALAEEGKLAEYTSILLYWCGIPELREEPVPGSLQGVIDSWNTMVMPRLIAISMQEDLAQRDLDYRAFKRWMEASLDITPGTAGGIKPDGCGFHHGGLYPAYSTGGFSGVEEYLRILKNTSYALDSESRANLKKALLCMVNYSVFTDWGFGICGRHPLAGNLSSSLIKTIGELAVLGDSKSTEAIDHELAGEYLRLGEKNGELASRFKKAGVAASLPPSGFFAYNYGSLGIHRRDNWMVSLKGYNKYVWSSEIYTKDNRFGRYQSYGTVQVMNAGNPVSASESGFQEEGWDWNRYPGATTIHLPLNLLESPYPETLMEKSEETFAGALSLEGQNGIFGMKLKENDRPRFTPDFVARKSVFCFDNRVVCLGSGISNSNTQYPTETILFQTALQKKGQGIELSNGKTVTDFPCEISLNSGKPSWMVDINGNGYYWPGSQKVTVRKTLQQSQNNKTKAATSGNFASAWIDHGNAPHDAGYEYAIWINSGSDQMRSVAQKMSTAAGNIYSVLKKNNSAHIVSDHETGIVGLVLFDAHSADTVCDVIDNSLPCLVMYKAEKDNRMRLSLVNPDLNLPDNSFTSDRPAVETLVSISIKGKWTLTAPSERCTFRAYKNGHTLLDFTCKDGLPVEIILEK